MQRLFAVLLLTTMVTGGSTQVALAQDSDVCVALAGARLVAQDDENTYLGKIANAFDGESIFNEFGKYGNEFQSNSIWNEFGKFGSEFHTHSPFNKLASKPPMIIKGGKVIGLLSTNKNLEGAISPSLLKALCEDEL
jgi:hypothetical protein